MLLDDLLTEPETATLPDLNDGLPCDPRPVFALDFSGCGYAVSYACATRGGEYLPPVTGVLGPASVGLEETALDLWLDARPGFCPALA